jgi:hypothetical protein
MIIECHVAAFAGEGKSNLPDIVLTGLFDDIFAYV